jgi:RHS repeat-associated protein
MRPDQQYLMMSRYYSSSLGRFMAADQDGRAVRNEDPQSWNRYAYVRNNPVNAFDPDGRKDARDDRDKAMLEDSDVKGQTREAWDQSRPDAPKNDRQEVGFGIVEDSPGQFSTTALQTEGNPRQDHMHLPDPVAGSVHTHPVGTGFVKDPSNGQVVGVSKKPGADDQKTAKDTNAPAYVVTKNKMYRVDPSGDIKVVLTGKDFKKYMGQQK